MKSFRNSPDWYLITLRWSSSILLVLTLILLFIGALVTSTDSGLSVPDWPTTYNYNMFTYPISLWVGGILYEHGHRLFASLVGFISLLLAFLGTIYESRKSVRVLLYASLILVSIQGVLGGLTVLYELPVLISVSHALMAQLFLISLAAICYASFSKGNSWLNNLKINNAWQWFSFSLMAVLFVQIGLGAILRHTHTGMIIPTFPLAFGDWWPSFWNTSITIHYSHSRIVALIVSLMTFIIGVEAWTNRDPQVRKTGKAMLAALLFQVFLGIWTVWSGKDPWIASAHLAGAGLLLTMVFFLHLLAPRLGVSRISSSRRQTRPLKKRMGDFIELMKLRMASLIVLTTFVGYFLGSDASAGMLKTALVLLGTAFMAISAFVFNQAREIEFDALMNRTKGRPLPSHRITEPEALVAGLICFLLGGALLLMAGNVLAAGLGTATVLLYVNVYTPMKRYSSLNTLVGAVPGAIPPLIGWTAATGSLTGAGWWLFWILFFWQIPHFLAIALMYKTDYAKGGFKMLSVTDPSGDACVRQIVLQTILLLFVTSIPFFLGLAGVLYLATVLFAGGVFLFEAFRLYRARTLVAAKRVFIGSIFYLPVILLTITISKPGL